MRNVWRTFNQDVVQSLVNCADVLAQSQGAEWARRFNQAGNPMPQDPDDSAEEAEDDAAAEALRHA